MSVQVTQSSPDRGGGGLSGVLPGGPSCQGCSPPPPPSPRLLLLTSFTHSLHGSIQEGCGAAIGVQVDHVEGLPVCLALVHQHPGRGEKGSPGAIRTPVSFLRFPDPPDPQEPPQKLMPLPSTCWEGLVLSPQTSPHLEAVSPGAGGQDVPSNHPPWGRWDQCWAPPSTGGKPQQDH